MRKTRAACGFNGYGDCIITGDDLLFGQFCKAARTPKAKLIALTFASSGNDPNDADNLGRRLIQVDGFERTGMWFRLFQRADDPLGDRRENVRVQYLEATCGPPDDKPAVAARVDVPPNLARAAADAIGWLK
jgi:hypothetical protein